VLFGEAKKLWDISVISLFVCAVFGIILYFVLIIYLLFVVINSLCIAALVAQQEKTPA